MKDPKKDELCRERYNALLPNLADYVEKYARERPHDIAIAEYNTGATVTWKRFNMTVNAFAAKLLSMGIGKGDIVATSLPMLKEHVYLMYACFRAGIIVAPLDLRLKAKEIKYCVEKIQPKAYFFVGVPQISKVIQEVMPAAPSVSTWVQFQKDESNILPGAISSTQFSKDIKKQYILSTIFGSVRKARRTTGKRNASVIIFTTGSTGSPKPALLCHENILVQSMAIAVAFEFNETDNILVNLPPSHVGCMTEQLTTAICGGGTAVLLHVFDPKKSLDAIQKHKVTMLGQIPALYKMEWRLPGFKDYDLSSLKFAIYGAQSMDLPSLEKMKAMAPRIATGLGLTETAGFCTYTDVNASAEEISKGIGYDQPICPISIREPMKPDGSAGDKKADGEIGEICFTGPQIFIGYMNDPVNTAKTISREGVLYTGDVGYYDSNGLHFAGKGKNVIKPKGFQVFPQDVEKHFSEKLKGKVGTIACVGAEHNVYSEAIILFVECLNGQTLTADEVMAASRDIASYSRPSHVEILKQGEIPIDRAAKTDYLLMKEKAKQIVEGLRAEGKWDR